MVLTIRRKTSLYQDAEAGLGSLVQQTVLVFVGFGVMLLLTGGKPTSSALTITFIFGIAFVAWSEQKRITKIRFQNKAIDMSASSLLHLGQIVESDSKASGLSGWSKQLDNISLLDNVSLEKQSVQIKSVVQEGIRQSRQSADLVKSIVQEGIRQSRQSANRAHWSFLIATCMTTMSAVLGVGGSGLLLIGKASDGIIATTVGLASGMFSLQLVKESAYRQKQAKKWLDEMLHELGEEDN